MEKAKRARKAEAPKRPSLCLRLRVPYLYPDLLVWIVIESQEGESALDAIPQTNTEHSAQKVIEWPTARPPACAPGAPLAWLGDPTRCRPAAAALADTGVVVDHLRATILAGHLANGLPETHHIGNGVRIHQRVPSAS